MKTIIAGSRTIMDFALLKHCILQSRFNITEVVSGNAKGVDSLGEYYAVLNNIPLKVFKADWDKHGKSAGIIRNCEMGDYADTLIALWDGKSRGTSHMIGYAKKKGLKVFVYNMEEH